ncbi:hypothetical protein BST61_g1937 [Cercospora zeina]
MRRWGISEALELVHGQIRTGVDEVSRRMLVARTQSRREEPRLMTTGIKLERSIYPVVDTPSRGSSNIDDSGNSTEAMCIYRTSQNNALYTHETLTPTRHGSETPGYSIYTCSHRTNHCTLRADDLPRSREG